MNGCVSTTLTLLLCESCEIFCAIGTAATCTCIAVQVRRVFRRHLDAESDIADMPEAFVFRDLLHSDNFEHAPPYAEINDQAAWRRVLQGAMRTFNGDLPPHAAH